MLVDAQFLGGANPLLRYCLDPAVHDYKISGSNSYSKLIARYQQDLLALHAAWKASQ